MDETRSLIEPSDLPEEAARAELGVLFVHGIGEQARGETLIQFGEPVLDWVRDWVRVRGEPDRYIAAPLSARIREPLADHGAPAHAEVLVGEIKDGVTQGQQWLFAEAWWGAQVLPPSIAEFTTWLLSRGGWTLLLHMHQVWVRPLAGIRQPRWVYVGRVVASGFMITLLWLVASGLMNLLLLLCALVAVVPIGRLRGIVYAVLRALAGVIGDAYLLIRSPTQAAAFEQTVTQALRWVRDRACSVVVVAHSQGAAIAHAALRLDTQTRVDGFVTVGAGIVKLEALKRFERRPAWDRAAPILAPPLVILALLAWTRGRPLLLPDAAAFFAPMFVSIIAATVIGGLWTSVVEVLDELREQSAAKVSLREERPGLIWCDIASTHDPVSAGNLSDWFDPDTLGVEAHRIPVLRSFLSDHTRYWQARASFMPLLARVLDRCAGGTLLRIAADDHRLVEARRRHDFDVRLLARAQWLNLAALALPIAFAHQRMIDGASAVRTWMAPADAELRDRAPLAVVDAALRWVEDALRWIARVFGGDAALSKAAVVNFAAAALGLVVLILAWSRIAQPLWQAWSAARHAETLNRRPLQASVAPAATTDWLTRAATTLSSAPERVWPLLRDLSLGVVLGVPIVLSLLWTFWPDAVHERDLWALPGLLFAILFAMGLYLGLLSDLGARLPTLRQCLRRLREPGRLWQWQTVLQLAHNTLLVIGGAGLLALMTSSVFGMDSFTRVAPALIGSAVFGRAWLSLLDAIHARLLALGASRPGRIVGVLAPLLVAVGAAAALAPWASPDVYWRGLPAVVAVLAMLTAMLEWLIVWAVGRARRGGRPRADAAIGPDPGTPG